MKAQLRITHFVNQYLEYNTIFFASISISLKLVKESDPSADQY